MKCKLLTTKTHRASGKRLSRGLAFEQMESRLALSATTGIDTTAVTELQWDRNAFLAALQGGFVDLGARDFSNHFYFQGTGSVQAHVAGANDIELNLRDWIQFEGTLGAYDSDSFTTIPQPTIGLTKPNGGMIAVDEIFAVAPLVKLGNGTHEVAQVVRGQFERAEAISTDERLSLTRARDVYFEVAVRVENDEFESQDRLGSSGGTVASEQFSADEEPNLKSKSVSITTLAARGRSLPAAQNNSPEDPADAEVQARDVAQPLRKAPSVTQSPESETKLEKATRSKQVSQTEVRDQVFQAWRDSKLDAMKRTPDRPEEEEHDDTASWPVLAALAVGGMVFSSRRLTRPASTQQLPPRRQKLMGNFLFPE
jgi:hypothetical protein